MEKLIHLTRAMSLVDDVDIDFVDDDGHSNPGHLHDPYGGER